jgi:hypothetical protein
VAEAEREQFRLGRSDILRVTLREQARFDADLVEIAARQEYWKADAELRAADTSLDRIGAATSWTSLLDPVPEGIMPDPGAGPKASGKRPER